MNKNNNSSDEYLYFGMPGYIILSGVLIVMVIFFCVFTPILYKAIVEDYDDNINFCEKNNYNDFLIKKDTKINKNYVQCYRFGQDGQVEFLSKRLYYK